MAIYLTPIESVNDLDPGDYVYVEVSDTGCGMTEEVQQRMFDPFFTTKFTGRGLGMAALLGIVNGHKGAVKIYSEEGKGSTIKVLLPVSDTEVATNVSATADRHDAQGGKALLVDDEESLRTLGRRMLEKMGYEVLLAVDGREGIQLFKEHGGEIAFVLLDLTMPHIGGQEAFREIRNIDPSVPVIMSSGYNEQDVTQHFVGRGLAGFIQKPYHHHELAAKLNEVFGSHLDGRSRRNDVVSDSIAPPLEPDQTH